MNTSSFLCQICSKNFLSKRSLNAHVSVHKIQKAFKCNLCDKDLSSQANLNDHILSQHEGINYRKNNFKCNVCYYEVHTGKLLTEHMRKHTGERPFTCTVDGCGKAFKVEKTLENHISYKHSNERPFECNFPSCHYTAKTNQDLIVHKRVHSDARPFACPNADCNYRAKFRQFIKRHVTTVHSEAKPLACTKCDFKTAHPSAFKAHVIHGHSTRKNFKCSDPQCTKSFKTTYQLSKHFSNRHGEKKIQCDHSGCEAKFSNSNALTGHKWSVHTKKSIACPNLSCKFRTNQASILARHMIKHDGNEKIPCPVDDCEFKGKNTNSIEKHLRHHKTHFACPIPGCSRKTFAEKALKNHIKLHNPVGRPFQCPLCCQYFPNWTRVFRHSFVHTNEKPLKCGHCEFANPTRRDLKRHISSVHANVKFPFIVLPLNVHECLSCKIKLPFAEFLVHSIGHVVPVVVIERLETSYA